MTYGLQHLKPQLVGDGNALFSTLQQYAGSIGTACVSTILAITAAQMPHQSTVVQTAIGTPLGPSIHMFCLSLAP